MFLRESLRRDDVNYVIYEAVNACEGRYGCMQGLIRVLLWANMGSRERSVMGLESQAVSAQVTKHFVTILSKTSNNGTYLICVQYSNKRTC